MNSQNGIFINNTSTIEKVQQAIAEYTLQELRNMQMCDDDMPPPLPPLTRKPNSNEIADAREVLMKTGELMVLVKQSYLGNESIYVYKDLHHEFVVVLGYFGNIVSVSKIDE